MLFLTFLIFIYLTNIFFLNVHKEIHEIENKPGCSYRSPNYCRGMLSLVQHTDAYFEV